VVQGHPAALLASSSNIGNSTTHSGCQPLLDQAEVVPELPAKGPEGVVHHLRPVGSEEDEIAVLGLGALEDPGHRHVGQELHDR
jgi:hypothetical protein